jgi:lysyl-tRNA synthetase class 1
MWRLDWPSRQNFLNVDIEGAGVDHHTRGGSWFTAIAIHKTFFGKDPPIGFKYGFLLFKGKKYSKSKALGLGVQELLDLVPPELLKYFLFRPDIEENKEFDPTGYKLIRLYEEYTQIQTLLKKKELTRAEQKDLLAYKLAGEKQWKANFIDILINYQIFRDWEIVERRVKDKAGVRYLRPYIRNWIEYGYVPKELVFRYSPTLLREYKDVITDFAKNLKESMTALDIHNLVYKLAERFDIRANKLFGILYQALIGKRYGPRFGYLVYTIGAKKVREDLLKIYTSAKEE